VPTSAVSSFDYWARETRVPQTATTTSVFWPLSDRRKFPQRHATHTTAQKKRKKAKKSLPNIGAHLTDLLVLVHHRVVDGRHIALSPLRLLSEKQICVEFFTLSLSLLEGAKGSKKTKNDRETLLFIALETEEEEEEEKKKRKRLDDEGAKSINHY